MSPLKCLKVKLTGKALDSIGCYFGSAQTVTPIQNIMDHQHATCTKIPAWHKSWSFLGQSIKFLQEKHVSPFPAPLSKAPRRIVICDHKHCDCPCTFLSILTACSYPILSSSAVKLLLPSPSVNEEGL